MDITILVAGYLLISFVCAVVLVSACIISGRTQEVNDAMKHKAERNREEREHTISKVTRSLNDHAAGVRT